jgi:hypothetical protein
VIELGGRQAIGRAGEIMNGDRGRIREIVEKRVASFEAAERALDASALAGHFSTAGDFYMHNDGQRLTAGAIATAVKQAFPTLRSLEGGFTGLAVHVLAADAAVATATFHETITTNDGTVVRQRGAAFR